VRAAQLEIEGLRARVTGGDDGNGAEDEADILRGVSLSVEKGEVHALMGKNGSGKSTLSKALVGHPWYSVTGGSVTLNGHDLLSMEPEERSHAGLFLSFQTPIEVSGVQLSDFLRLAYNEHRKARGEQEVEPLEFYSVLLPKARWSWYTLPVFSITAQWAQS
jgi:Fe-S cluster assembly ATP-binding protein